MTRPIVLQPQYAFTATASDKNVLIVPTSNRTIISKNDRHIQSGGDEEEVRWDTKFRQSFIFMAHDGGNLSGDFRTEFKRIDATVEGQTDDGYVVIEMLCRDWGSSSSGGNRSFDDAGPVLEN